MGRNIGAVAFKVVVDDFSNRGWGFSLLDNVGRNIDAVAFKVVAVDDFSNRGCDFSLLDNAG